MEIKDYLEKAKKYELIKRGLYNVKYLEKNSDDPERIIVKSGDVLIEYLPYEVSDEEYQKIIQTNYIREAEEYYPIMNSKIFKKGYKSIYPIILNIFGIIVFLTFAILSSISENGLPLLFIMVGFIISTIFFSLSKIISLLVQR